MSVRDLRTLQPVKTTNMYHPDHQDVDVNSWLLAVLWKPNIGSIREDDIQQ